MFIFQCFATCAAALQALLLALRRQRAAEQALPPLLYRSEAFAEDLIEPPAAAAPATLPERLATLLVELGRAAQQGNPLPLWHRLG